MRGEWCYQPGLLTHAECDRAIEHGKALNPGRGTIGLKGDAVDDSMRTSETAFIERGGPLDDIFAKIDAWVAVANETWFGVDYRADGLRAWQFSIYREGQYYRPHIDCTLSTGGMPSQRKISVSVQLSDASDYEGGEFMFHHTPAQPPADILVKRGTALAFPSLVMHEVMPVLSGTRYALVGWYPGSPWR